MDHHRVCSEHFKDGKKKDVTDIPNYFQHFLSFPKKKKRPTPRVSIDSPPTNRMKGDSETPKPPQDALVECMFSLCQTVPKFCEENCTLKQEVNKLKFCLQ